MNSNILLTIKITLGFIISLMIAYLFKLPYFYTTGVITLLSLEKTRLKSYNIALIRLFSMILAFSLGSLLFHLLNFTLLSVIIFILIFIPLSYLIKLERGLSVSLVLVSQIFLEKDLYFTLNAFYIFFIGVGVGLLLNLIIIKYDQKIKENISLIDNEINSIIQTISINLAPSFITLDHLINETFNLIENEIENIYSSDVKKYLNYIEMRNEQTKLLKNISYELLEIKEIPEKTIILNYLKLFENQIGTKNYALELNDKLDELFKLFKKRPLPEKREAFELRARLYTLLLEIKQFLNLKLLYHSTYQNEIIN